MKESDIDESVNNSINSHERECYSVNDIDLLRYYPAASQNLNFSGSNSVSSVQAENLNFIGAEKIIEDSNVLALERLVYSLLVDGHTKKAKDALEEFSDVSSPQLEKWKNAFSRVPNIKPRKASLKKDEIKNEAKWIKENNSKFISQWVALISGEVIASASSLEKLRKELGSHGNTGNVTFLKL